jgi:hypothetical protein
VKRTRCLLLSAVVLVLALVGSSSIWAQTTSSLRGTVKDQSGGLVVGARITLKNTATGITRTTQSGSDGSYLFDLLSVGTYNIAVAKAGFVTVEQTGIVLQLNQNGRLDVALNLGQTNQTIEVTANVVQIDTAGSTLGKVEDERAIRDLPLVDRDTLQLGLLQAGVFAPDPDDSTGNPFSVSGQRSESLTFLLDGGNNTDFLGNNIVVSPNPDAVEEFKILTNNYDAEYGRTSGGIVNQITKSGTNSIHGDGFEFLRNTDLNARDAFAPERSSFIRNVFGGTLGGPIKRDKLFFFLAYQGARRREGQTPTPIAVLDQAERGGDFSELLPGIQLVNPITGANYVNNQVPVNPVIANYIAQFLPLPNGPGNTFSASPTASINDDQGIAHIDYNLSTKDTFSFVYLVDNSSDFFPEEGGTISATSGAVPIGSGGTVPVGSGGTDGDRSQIGTFTWTHTLSSGKVNQFRFAANRFSSAQAFPTDKTSPASLGFTNLTPADPTDAVEPTIFGPSFTLGPSIQGPTTLKRATFEWSDDYTWTVGRHEIKFGGDFTRIRQNYYYDYYNSGGFDFTYGDFTGDEYADFVGGFWDNYFQFDNATYGLRTGSAAGYLQDTWKILPRLTLNYGLRYEFYVPIHDIHNNISGWFPGQQSTIYPDSPPNILYAGDPGTPNRALVYPDYRNIAPRLGFAWDMFGNAKLVMRGGAGIFYDLEDGALNLQFGGQPPFGQVADETPSSWQGVSGDQTSSGATTGSVADPFTSLGYANPFPYVPNGTFDYPSPSCLSCTPFSFGYLAYPQFRTPYSENFNYGFQWQATKDIMIEAVYVGSMGRRLISSAEVNYPQTSIMQYQLATYEPYVAAGVISTALNPECARKYANCQDGTINPNDPYDPTGVPFGPQQLLVDYSNGLSDSDQMQITADKRMSNGLQFRAAYTVAKTIDLTSGFRSRSGEYTDPTDYRLDRALADFDSPQRVVLSAIWELPISHWGHSAFTKKALEGWQVDGIVTFQKGNPLTFFSNSNASEQDQSPDLTRTDVTGKVAYVNPRSASTFAADCNGQNSQAGPFWINPSNMSCTACPESDPDCTLSADAGGIPLFTYGNLGRNSLRGPGINNWDGSIIKNTHLTESKVIEFRAEFFNAFNHTQFYRVDDAGGSSTFGQVLSDRGPRLIQFGLKLYF